MDKEQTAILRLQEASRMSLIYYEQPLIITTSGGKDSDICLALAKRAGIPYEVQHNLTTADAPQTRSNISSVTCKNCTMNIPVCVFPARYRFRSCKMSLPRRTGRSSA